MKISEDKKTISLSVPLGGVVYTYSTSCNDACTFQETNVNRKELFCSPNSMCHVKFCGVREVEVSFFNLQTIIPNWGIEYFGSYKEAEKAGIALTEKHKEMMRKKGFGVSQNR